MVRNALTQLGLKWPILQAPMARSPPPLSPAAVGQQRRWTGRAQHVGITLPRTRSVASRGSASRALAAERELPALAGTEVTGEASGAMRKERFAVHYDAHGLGSVPQPRGTASEVGSEQLAMLLSTKAGW